MRAAALARCLSPLWRNMCTASADNLAAMRERAQKGFVALSEAPARQRSWVLGEEYDTNAADPNRVAFDHHGFLVVKVMRPKPGWCCHPVTFAPTADNTTATGKIQGFANVAECDKMRGAMADFIEEPTRPCSFAVAASDPHSEWASPNSTVLVW